MPMAAGESVGLVTILPEPASALRSTMYLPAFPVREERVTVMVPEPVVTSKKVALSVEKLAVKFALLVVTAFRNGVPTTPPATGPTARDGSSEKKIKRTAQRNAGSAIDGRES